MDYGCSTVLEPRGVAHTPRRHDGVSSATVRRDSTHEVAPGLNGSTPVAVRYAWSNEVDSCCESLAPTQACQPEAGLPDLQREQHAARQSFLCADRRRQMRLYSPSSVQPLKSLITILNTADRDRRGLAAVADCMRHHAPRFPKNATGTFWVYSNHSIRLPN